MVALCAVAAAFSVVLESLEFSLESTLEAHFVFGRRANFVHALASRFRHAVERFVRLRQDVVCALCDRFGDALNLWPRKRFKI